MTEPQFVQRTQYPLTRKAEARQHRGRIREYLAGIIASAAAVLIVAIVVGVTYHEATATRAADAVAVVSKPTATPGIPVPQRTKPVEQSPELADRVPGDGTWLIGREIKRGTYRAEGGEWCVWERLRDLSGEGDGVMSEGFVNGPQLVAMGPDDVAFSSQGCGPWVMIP